MPRTLAAIARGVSERQVKIDQGLCAHAAIFDKAEAQYVNACIDCDVGRRTAQMSHRIGEPRAIHMQAKLAFAAQFA